MTTNEKARPTHGGPEPGTALTVYETPDIRCEAHDHLPDVPDCPRPAVVRMVRLCESGCGRAVASWSLCVPCLDNWLRDVDKPGNFDKFGCRLWKLVLL